MAKPDLMIANVRGVARANTLPMWGTFAAHEWYGGLRHEDTLKQKRLELAYKYAYLSGSQIFLLKSGDTGISSYGCQYPADSVICQNYKTVIRKMADFIKQDARPKGGPKVRVAFVTGLHDGWAGHWGRSCLWNQFYREEWGYNEAEHSWRILEEMGTKRAWDDLANYGGQDLSAVPANPSNVNIPYVIERAEGTKQCFAHVFSTRHDGEEKKVSDVTFVEDGGKLKVSLVCKGKTEEYIFDLED